MQIFIPMEVTVTFIFNENPYQISCKSDQKMGQILSQFATEFKVDKNDFEFFYNGKKIDENSTYSSHTIANNISISTKKKSKIMKCPTCICNNCLIKIEDYKLNFSDCCHNHKQQKIFEEYEEAQRINYDRIECGENSCKKKQKNCLEDFYKCMECSALIEAARYFCKECSDKHAKSDNHNLKKYDEKYYYCSMKEHYNEYVSYCSKCNLNLCDKCEEAHDKNHEIIKLDQMVPDSYIEKIKENLEEIKEKTKNLKNIVVQIKNMMDHSLNIIKKYYDIARDIIGKYESYNKKLKNYQVLKTINCLSDSNKKIMNDLNTITEKNEKEDDWINKCKILINIFKCDREFYSGKSGIIDKVVNSNKNGGTHGTLLNQKTETFSNTPTVTTIEVSNTYQNIPASSKFSTGKEEIEKTNQ